MSKINNTIVVAGIAAAVSAGLTALYLKKKRNQPSPYDIPQCLLESPFAAELQLAVKLALECGDNMVPHCQERGTVHAQQQDSEKSLQVEFKGNPQDFCTAIDLKNEELVVKAIQEAFPSHDIIGEESIGTGELPPLTDNATWIIDPGTLYWLVHLYAVLLLLYSYLSHST